MSFLSRSTPFLCTSTISLTSQSTRLFSTTLAQNNTIKDVAKKVDRTVSDQLVKGIDKSIETKDAAAEAVGANTHEAKAKAEELKGEAKGKAEQVKGQANAVKEEAKAKI